MAIKTITEKDDISKLKKKQKVISDSINLEERKLEDIIVERKEEEKDMVKLKKEILSLVCFGDELKAGNDVLLNEKNELERELSDKKDELKVIRVSVKDAIDDMDIKMKQAVAESNEKIKIKTNLVVAKNKEIDALSVDIGIKDNQNKKLDDENKSLKDDIIKNTKLIEKMNADIKIKDEESTGLSGYVDRLKGERAEIDRTIKVLNRKSVDRDRKIIKKQELLGKLKEQIELTEKELEKKREEVESKKDMMLALFKREQKVDHLSRKLERLYKKAGVNITI